MGALNDSYAHWFAVVGEPKAEYVHFLVLNLSKAYSSEDAEQQRAQGRHVFDYTIPPRSKDRPRGPDSPIAAQGAVWLTAVCVPNTSLPDRVLALHSSKLNLRRITSVWFHQQNLSMLGPVIAEMLETYRVSLGHGYKAFNHNVVTQDRYESHYLEHYPIRCR